jgi:hypothetical protein
MAGLLFITAPEANYKNINEALLSMRDWDDSNGGPDVFKLVIDKSTVQSNTDTTSIPLKRLPGNAWISANLGDIESYCLDLKRDDNDEQTGANLFVLIDSAGLESKTCIPDYYYDGPSASLGKYDKVRVPWDDLYMIWCNLDIANMNFEEFLKEEGDEQGWFTYQNIYEDDEEHKKDLRRRDEKVEEWRRLGHV